MLRGLLLWGSKNRFLAERLPRFRFVQRAVRRFMPGETPEAALLSREMKERVRAVVPSLPDRERQLIEGFYFQGRRFDHVAEELGISKSWASRLHHKALARLKDALGDP